METVVGLHKSSSSVQKSVFLRIISVFVSTECSFHISFSNGTAKYRAVEGDVCLECISIWPQ